MPPCWCFPLVRPSDRLIYDRTKHPLGLKNKLNCMLKQTLSVAATADDSNTFLTFDDCGHVSLSV